MNIIGIDIGASSSKIVVKNNSELKYKSIKDYRINEDCFTKVIDEVLSELNLHEADIEKICITGSGLTSIKTQYKNIPLVHVEEFDATCRGTRFISNIDSSIVISMGTGTAFYNIEKDSFNHVIGTGIGGGTLTGLLKLMLGIDNIQIADDMAMKGDTANIDLTIGDIANGDMPGLPSDLTASNFAKACDDSSDNDIAAAIFNMVLQSIGTLMVSICRNYSKNTVVLTGQVSTLKNAEKVLSLFSKFYGVDIVFPENSAFATAIGACIGEN